MNNHSESSNRVGYVDRSVSGSKDTRHSSSCNREKWFMLKGYVDIGL